VVPDWFYLAGALVALCVAVFRFVTQPAEPVRKRVSYILLSSATVLLFLLPKVAAVPPNPPKTVAEAWAVMILSFLGVALYALGGYLFASSRREVKADKTRRRRRKEGKS
jgi:predicted membrane channel-forming protein YqfA (hemolysin III family)